MNESNLRALLLLAALLTCAQPALAAEETAGGGQGETGTADAEASAADEPTIDERLDALMNEVSTYESREITRCLNPRTYRSVKVLNTDYLLFSRGERFWLNRLKRSCPTLKYNDLPVFESRGTSSLCEGDPFYPTNSMDLQMGLDSTGRPRAMYGTCYLGSFETISAEQAALLMGSD